MQTVEEVMNIIHINNYREKLYKFDEIYANSMKLLNITLINRIILYINIENKT